jgi:putative membrane protein
MRIILRILINAVALWVTAQLLPGIELTGSVGGLLLVALIFGVVNAFIKPIVKLLSLPITVVTLGLFTLVINAAMLLLTSWLAGAYMNFTGSLLDKVVTSVIGAIVISIVSLVLGWILPDGKA